MLQALLYCVLQPSIPDWVDESTFVLRRQGTSWKVKTYRDEVRWRKYTVIVQKNGGEVFRKTIDTQVEGFVFVKAMMGHYPVPYPVLVISSHSGIGHHQVNWFYQWKGGTFRLIHEVCPDLGGPVFRDMDGDGELEWLFDDYDFYEYYERLPKWIDAYKLRGGKLTRWKRYPNRHKIQLTDEVGIKLWHQI